MTYDYLVERIDSTGKRIRQWNTNSTYALADYKRIISVSPWKVISSRVHDPNANISDTSIVQTGPIYRLILPVGSGTSVDTGATYPSCSRENSAACDPKHFGSRQEALNYAKEKGEVPVMVTSVAHAWDIVEGRRKPSIFSGLQTAGASTLLWGLGGIFLLSWFGRKRDTRK